LKFEDVIMAVASLIVVYILVYSVLSMALVPTNSSWGLNVAFIVSVLVSALIVGYFFAGKIQEESRMASVGKIVVLSAFVIMFVVLIGSGAIGHHNALTDETLRNTYHTSSWTNTDWVAYETVALVLNTAVNVLGVLALGFVGLYLGSMLKPSAKTKEAPLDISTV
jgi:hypothetical protein